LLDVPAAMALALAPLPALSVERTKLTSVEPLTSTAILDAPLPAPSTPVAFCETNPMSSI
jgi:hypothetical protein